MPHQAQSSSPATPEQIFIRKLNIYISTDFFQKAKSDQLAEVLHLRNNLAFMNLLLSHWQLSCMFLDKIISGDPLVRMEIMGTRLKNLYRLNDLRRLIIPSAEVRRELPMEVQQQMVFAALSRQAMQSQREQVSRVPEVKQTVRAEAIEKLNIEGVLEIPDDLACPISGLIFVDPVKVTQLGKEFVFEKEFILEALKRNPTNPINRQPLDATDLKPAPEVKAKVEAYKQNLMQGEHAEEIQAHIGRVAGLGRGPRAT